MKTRPIIFRMVIVLLFAIALQVVFQAANRVPSHWDPMWNAYHAAVLAGHIQTDGIGFDYPGYLQQHWFETRPLFIMVAASLWLLLPGTHPLPLMLVVLAAGSFLVTARFLYLILKRFACTESLPLALFIYLVAPGIISNAHFLYPDILLVPAVTAAFYLFLTPPAFRGGTAVFSASMLIAIGVMIKLPFVIFLTPLALIAGYRYYSARNWGMLRRLLFVLLLGAIFATLWYGPHYRALATNLVKWSYTDVIDSYYGSPLELRSHSKFAQDVFFYQFPVIFSLFLLPAWWAARRGKSRALADTLVWFCVGTYLIFSLLGNKHGRFVLPLIPCFALLISLGVHSFSRRAKSLSLVIIIGFGLAQGLCATVDLTALPARIRLGPVPLLIRDLYHDTAQQEENLVGALPLESFAFVPARDDDYGLARVVAAISAAPGPANPLVAVIADHFAYNSATLRYHLFRAGIPAEVLDANYDLRLDRYDFDFIVCKDKYRSLYAGENRKLEEAVNSGFSNYQLLDQFPLRDGSTVSVYRLAANAR